MTLTVCHFVSICSLISLTLWETHWPLAWVSDVGGGLWLLFLLTGTLGIVGSGPKEGRLDSPNRDVLGGKGPRKLKRALALTFAVA